MIFAFGGISVCLSVLELICHKCCVTIVTYWKDNVKRENYLYLATVQGGGKNCCRILFKSLPILRRRHPILLLKQQIKVLPGVYPHKLIDIADRSIGVEKKVHGLFHAVLSQIIPDRKSRLFAKDFLKIDLVKRYIRCDLIDILKEKKVIIDIVFDLLHISICGAFFGGEKADDLDQGLIDQNI